MTSRRLQWEASYRARQNFVFWPSEEVVRFVATFVRQRVGLDAFTPRDGFDGTVRWLDLGCGIGRHVLYGHQMGFEAYGLDQAREAVEVARQWGAQEGLDEVDDRIRVGDAANLDWPDGFFDVVVSCSALDSMPFQTAQAAVGEVRRVLAGQGVFYCDLISGDDSNHARQFAGDQIVRTEHERDTIQSYFNFARIERLLAGGFRMLQCKLIRHTDVLTGTFHSRYHVALRKE